MVIPKNRDAEALAKCLTGWLAGQIPGGRDPEVAHQPEEGSCGVVWGDARLGNMIIADDRASRGHLVRDTIDKPARSWVGR